MRGTTVCPAVKLSNGLVGTTEDNDLDRTGAYRGARADSCVPALEPSDTRIWSCGRRRVAARSYPCSSARERCSRRLHSTFRNHSQLLWPFFTIKSDWLGNHRLCFTTLSRP